MALRTARWLASRRRQRARNSTVRSFTRRSFRNCRGAAAVEFAFVAPFILFLVFGSIEFARMVMIKQVLTSAARDGCRHAGAHPMRIAHQAMAVVVEGPEPHQVRGGPAVEHAQWRVRSAHRHLKLRRDVAVPVEDELAAARGNAHQLPAQPQLARVRPAQRRAEPLANPLLRPSRHGSQWPPKTSRRSKCADPAAERPSS